MKKLLDERKKKVLQAIVEEYINTAEPVSSNALTQSHGLECSSATIRNEMSELEKDMTNYQKVMKENYDDVSNLNASRK